MNRKINVLMIDDSALVRKALSQLLSSDPDINLLGAAPDPIFAERYLQKEWPDVIVLDLEMPRMDGMTFLKNIMREHPTPIVVCSALTQEGAHTTLDALAAGAVTTVAKPTSGIKDFFTGGGQHLIAVVKAAAGANLRPLTHTRAPERIRPQHSPTFPHTTPATRHTTLNASSERIVLMGASTGGTQAIEAVLRELPETVPPIAIVQHMPPHFTAALAARLDNLCAISVKEAASGDRLRPGRALIAPGGRHLTVARSGAQYYVEVTDTERVNRHKPSVDVLFHSAATLGGGPHFQAVLMTGMGYDGAQGLLALKLTRSHTIAQDEASSVVFGMPREAIRLGAAGRVLPLSEIPNAIVDFMSAGV